MADKPDDRERGYIVISTTLEGDKKYEGCRVIPPGDVYPAIYRRVFGPASGRDCERWVTSNCGKSARATSRGA